MLGVVSLQLTFAMKLTKVGRSGQKQTAASPSILQFEFHRMVHLRLTAGVQFSY
jgi:hypothetical protein